MDWHKFTQFHFPAFFAAKRDDAPSGKPGKKSAASKKAELNSKGVLGSDMDAFTDLSNNNVGNDVVDNAKPASTTPAVPGRVTNTIFLFVFSWQKLPLSQACHLDIMMKTQGEKN